MSYDERTSRFLQAKGCSLEIVKILSQVRDLRPLIHEAKERDEAGRCPNCGHRHFRIANNQEGSPPGPTLWNIDCEWCGAQWRVPSNNPMLDFTT